MENKYTYLAHYASQYYDPVKAHEYYMKHRELKNRTSTAQLNEEGKKTADYVKNQLNAERDQKIKSHSDATNAKINTLNDQKKSNIEIHKNEMSSRIKSLQNTLSNMSKEQKAANRERIMGQINILRENNNKERERLQAEFKASSNSLRSDHKTTKSNITQEYNEKYADELDKIRSESQYQKVSKTSKKKSTK